MKKFLAIVMVAVIAVMCTACGLDMSKVKGDWTLSAVNGQPVSEYAEANGMDAADIVVNWTVSDKSVTVTSSVMSATYDIEVKSNGFEVKQGASLMSVTYDDKNSTLSYAIEAGGVKYDYVLTKGTASVDSATEEAAPAEE